MADNLSVSVTADTSELRAQLALAQADLRAFGAETKKLANDIRSGGDAGGVLRSQLEQVAGSHPGRDATREPRHHHDEQRAQPEREPDDHDGNTDEWRVRAHAASGYTIGNRDGDRCPAASRGK